MPLNRVPVVTPALSGDALQPDRVVVTTPTLVAADRLIFLPAGSRSYEPPGQVAKLETAISLTTTNKRRSKRNPIDDLSARCPRVARPARGRGRAPVPVGDSLVRAHTHTAVFSGVGAEELGALATPKRSSRRRLAASSV